jgi:hypothetical protein
VDEILKEIKQTQSMIKKAQFNKTFVKWVLEASGSAIVCSEFLKGLVEEFLAYVKGECGSEIQEYEVDATADSIFQIIHPW